MSATQDDEDQEGRGRLDGPPRKPNGMEGINAGYVLVASVLLGLGLGYLIDDWANVFPLWTVLLSGLFIVAGLYQVVKEAMRK